MSQKLASNYISSASELIFSINRGLRSTNALLDAPVETKTEVEAIEKSLMEILVKAKKVELALLEKAKNELSFP